MKLLLMTFCLALGFHAGGATSASQCEHTEFSLQNYYENKLSTAKLAECCLHWTVVEDEEDCVHPMTAKGDEKSICPYRCLSWDNVGPWPVPEQVDEVQELPSGCTLTCPAQKPKYCIQWAVDTPNRNEWQRTLFKCTKRSETKPKVPNNKMCGCLKKSGGCRKEQRAYAKTMAFGNRCSASANIGKWRADCKVAMDALIDKTHNYCQLKAQNSDTTQALEALEWRTQQMKALLDAGRCPNVAAGCLDWNKGCEARALCKGLTDCSKRLQNCVR